MAGERESKIKKEIHGGEEVDVVYLRGMPGLTAEEMLEKRARGENVHRFRFCPPLDPRTFEPEPGVVCHRDMSMRLRDGAAIYFDLYLPEREDKAQIPVPLIISWSMFGKRMSEGPQPFKILGVPDDAVSKMCKFESRTRATGAETATRSPTSTYAAAATARATAACSARTTRPTATISWTMTPIPPICTATAPMCPVLSPPVRQASV